MAETTHHRSLAKVTQPARLPGWLDLLGWMVGLGAVTSLALATAAVRFQLVDWRVEAARLQEQVRRAEAVEIDLRNDVARGQRADRLRELATETLQMAPAASGNLSEISLAPMTLARYEKAFELTREPEPALTGLKVIAPISAIVSEKFSRVRNEAEAQKSPDSETAQPPEKGETPPPAKTESSE